MIWEDKHYDLGRHHYECFPLPSSSPRSKYWSLYPMAWNIPLSPCPLAPNSLLPHSSLVGWDETWERPWLCARTPLWKHKLPCVINIVFSTNQNHSPIPSTLKEIISAADKIITFGYYLIYLCTWQRCCLICQTIKWRVLKNKSLFRFLLFVLSIASL